MANPVMRNRIADYLNIGTTDAPDFVVMGAGFTALDEQLNAQTESRAYISDTNLSTHTTSYQPQFAYKVDLMDDVDVITELYDIGADRLVGEAAQRDYVRVDLWKGGMENEYPARLFRVEVQPDSNSGSGAAIVQVTGNLNQLGDAVKGTFNTVTRTFMKVV